VAELKAAKARPWTSSSALFLLLIPVCIVGVALLAKGLYPVDLPSTKNPDFIDTVFDNRAVLWTARFLLVSAAVILVFGGFFIVVSIGRRMKNGEWLKRAGPFEISEPAVHELAGQTDFWRTTALMVQEEAAELTERLKESDALIEQLRCAYASEPMVGTDHL
jgi:hypothetical protein